MQHAALSSSIHTCAETCCHAHLALGVLFFGLQVGPKINVLLLRWCSTIALLWCLVLVVVVLVVLLLLVVVSRRQWRERASSMERRRRRLLTRGLSDGFKSGILGLVTAAWCRHNTCCVQYRCTPLPCARQQQVAPCLRLSSSVPFCELCLLCGMLSFISFDL